MTPDWLVAVGASCTALLAIVAFWKWALPFLRRLGHAVDDILGEAERPGVPARPGIVEGLADANQRIAQVSGELAAIRKEVNHNGGGSLKDAVRRIEAAQAEDRRALDTLAAAVGAFVAREQVVRLEGTRAQGEMWEAVKKVAEAEPPGRDDGLPR